MTPREITSIAVKFFGIYLLVNVVLYLPSMIVSITALQQYYQENFDTSIFIIVVGAFLILGVAVSFALFKFANSIAKQAPAQTDTPSGLSQAFLLQVLGIYFVVSALSAFPGIGISVFKSTAGTDYSKLFLGFGYLFQLVVGLYLLIKPKFWLHLLNKFRGRT